MKQIQIKKPAPVRPTPQIDRRSPSEKTEHKN